ncbi:MAG: hypothetical protein GX442_13860 [Candidatus Riflebacteria bacterium]|nr:hypothetical protein [Candidatus Riflebacteria bacterium]
MAHPPLPVAGNPGAPPEFLQLLFFDLEASSRGVRLAAIVQLMRFAADPAVQATLQERLQAEDDEECRQHLQHVLRMGAFRQGRLVTGMPPGGNAGPTAPSPGTRPPERAAAGAVTAPVPPGPPGASVTGAGVGPAPDHGPRRVAPPGPAPHDTSRGEGPPPRHQPDPAPTPGDADLVAALRMAGPETLPELVSRLERLPEADRAGRIAVLLAPDTPVGVLLPVLELPERTFREPALLRVLPALLDHPHTLVILRALHILSGVAPDRTLDRLPALLQHASLQVRVAAIRLLSRLAPAEALRLLDELLDSPDPELVSTGLGLMFVFPFEEVTPLVIRLVEENRIGPAAMPLLEGLVRSNPDRAFLARLVNLALRRPQEAAVATRLAPLASEALSISGLEPGNPAAILARFTDRERLRLSRLVAPVLGPAAPPPAAPIPAPTAPRTDHAQAPVSPPAAIPGGTAAAQSAPTAPTAVPPPVTAADPPDLEARLHGWGALSTLAGRDTADLLSLLPRIVSSDGIGRTIAILHQHRVKDPPAVAWLEGLLEHPQDSVRLAAMDALGDLAPRVLLRHLPVLAFLPAPAVATQAVRHLRRLEGGAFLKRIQAWIADPHPRGREAALIGLLQLDFGAARAIVLRAIRQARDPAVVESLGNVLLMNPEPRSLAELQALRPAATGRRRDVIVTLISHLESALQEMRGPDGGGGLTAMAREFVASLELEGKLDQALEQIRAIHYRTSAPDGEPLIDSAWLLWGGAGLTFLLSIWIGVGWLWPAGDSLDTRKNAEPVTTRIPLPAIPAGEIQPGKRLTGALQGFDPLNRSWRFLPDGGPPCKLLAPASAWKPGDRLTVEVAAVERSPLGFPVITPRAMMRLGGKPATPTGRPPGSR